MSDVLSNTDVSFAAFIKFMLYSYAGEITQVNSAIKEILLVIVVFQRIPKNTATTTPGASNRLSTKHLNM